MKRIFNKIKNNKMLLFLSVLILGLAIVLIARFTYAYLLAQYGSAVKKDVVLKTDTTDNFKISIGDPLSISATSTTLPKGGSNIVKTSKSTVSLLANSTTKSVSKQYYVYFQIPSNSFVYSDGTTPEIVLSITGPSGEVTSISGLTYGTYSGVNGFDVTTKTGSFAIASAQAISSSSSTSATTENWTFTLTYLNLASVDQSTNYGHTMSTKVIVSKTSKLVTDYCANGDNFAECIMAYANSVGSSNSNIYIHNSKLTNGAVDGSYRYSGASDDVNNYVCFGSTANVCPNDNLYRIIYIKHNQAELIKATPATKDLLGTDGDYSSYYSTSSLSLYRWNYAYNKTQNNGHGSNNWMTSLLNKTNLNTNFVNNIGSDWSAKIDDTNWMIGGADFTMVTTAGVKNMYNKEMNSNSSTTYSAKIGLMYASDYGFAADPKYWTLPSNDEKNENDIRKSIDENWLYNGGYDEPTIIKKANHLYDLFRINELGYINCEEGLSNNIIRPVFNLLSSTTYVSGDGTKTNPYRIN